LVGIALALPRARVRRRAARRAPRLWLLRLVGFLAGLGFFVGIYGMPNALGKHARIGTLVALQPVYILVFLGYFLICLVTLRRWTGRANWGDAQALALITGVLTPSILISLIVPVMHAELQPLITVPFFLWLVWLAWRVKPSPAQPEAVTLA
jgi:hypothetical protein